MNKKAKLCRRNPLHNHPLLFKGGVHRKTNKSKRRLEKVKMKKEWLPQSVFTRVYFGEGILFDSSPIFV
ncbi:MAG: hypothetical protein ACR2PU_03735 [Gammaproteobacteria bacterium]